MRIALVQMDIAWESPGENLARASGLVGEAARLGADLALLPEMFATGFTMNRGAVTDAHAELAGMASSNRINIVAGYAAHEPGKALAANLAAAYDRTGARIALYQKMHPFSYAGEDRVFEPGQSEVVFGIDGAPSSVFICYDLRFPELMRRTARRVWLMLFLANWPRARALHWDALLCARAIENQCFTAGVNRVGRDGNGVAYGGGSAVYGPMGELVVRAGGGEETVLCEIDPALAARVRKEYPFLEDMKQDRLNT